MPTSRNSGTLRYTFEPIDGGAYASINAFVDPDDLGMCFGGVTPKAPTSGQRPVYRAWFVPTALGDVQGTYADAGKVYMTVTPAWNGVGSSLSALTVRLDNGNAEGYTVAGILYVELIHSVVQ